MRSPKGASVKISSTGFPWSPCRVPPLRERREDIIGLAEAFAESYCQRYGRPSLRITNAERACLLNYSWPGNVRELKNIIERAVT